MTQDERDAVILISTLVRAIGKWDADYRIKKRADRADDWLRRYYAKHPELILRDDATLSAGN